MLNKLDAPRIMVLTIMACALVVSSNRRLASQLTSFVWPNEKNIIVMVAKRTTMRAQFTFSTLEVYHA